jgi:hypothetical protein
MTNREKPEAPESMAFSKQYSPATTRAAVKTSFVARPNSLNVAVPESPKAKANKASNPLYSLSEKSLNMNKFFRSEKR